MNHPFDFWVAQSLCNYPKSIMQSSLEHVLYNYIKQSNPIHCCLVVSVLLPPPYYPQSAHLSSQRSHPRFLRYIAQLSLHLSEFHAYQYFILHLCSEIFCHRNFLPYASSGDLPSPRSQVTRFRFRRMAKNFAQVAKFFAIRKYFDISSLLFLCLMR